MLSENAMEKMGEILVNRTEQLNTLILEEIGNAIKQIGAVKPSQAHKLAQILKYGGSYKKIMKKLAEITSLNIKDIEKIMEIVAKENLAFAKQFYDYRGIDFIPYEQNKPLQRQVEVMTRRLTDDYLQMSKHLAFKTIGANGKPATTSLSKLYQTVIDNAILNVSKGQETYATEMRKVMRTIADGGIRVTDKGIKTVDYPSGYTRRLDSTVRMNILDGMRDFSNDLQKELGKEFGANGVEISVHANPAEDHAHVQGKQYSMEEFEKLNGKEINGEYVGGQLKRPISTMNCYHYIFSIILGVNRPQYSEKELDNINTRNEDGFTFEGKKYTRYQGTQLQRQIETKIRTLKDRQILARASGDVGKPMVIECQTKIRQLTEKYNELSKASGLSPKANRLSVSGYKHINYKEPVIETPTPTPAPIVKLSKSELKKNQVFISANEAKQLDKYFIDYYKEQEHLRPFEEERYRKLLDRNKKGYKDETITLKSIDDCKELLDRINISIEENDIYNSDFRLVSEASQIFYKNAIKSKSVMEDLQRNKKWLTALPTTDGVANASMNRITLNNRYFNDYEKFKKMCIDYTEPHEYVGGKTSSWWSETAKGRETEIVITHEFGHILHKEAYFNIASGKNKKGFDFHTKPIFYSFIKLFK